MRTEHLSPLQFAWLTATLITGGGLFILPRVLAAAADQDAWFSYILPLWWAFLVIQVLYLLSKWHPGLNVFEINRKLLGRYAGGVINALIIMYFCLLITRDVRTFTFFAHGTLLLKTPQEVIILTFFLMIIYFARHSLEDQVRINDLIFPLFVLLILSLPLALCNELSILRIRPFLVTATGKIASSNVLQSGWFGDVFVLGAFMHTIPSSHVFKASLRFGVSMSAVFLTLLILLTVTVLGHQLAGSLMFPVYSTIQQIHLTDFLDRLELFVYSIWIPVVALKVTFVYTAALYGLASFFGHRTYGKFNRPFGLLLVLFTCFAFRRILDLFIFGSFGAMLINFSLLIPLFSILLIRGYVRSHKPQADSPQKCNPGRSAARWGLAFNAGTFISILPALLWGRINEYWGYAGAFLYPSCLLALVICAYVELKVTGKHSTL